MKRTYVIRSFLSFPFLRPPKAILVPGMYFLGFSKYSNWAKCQQPDYIPRFAHHTKVSSFHVIALCLFASVYEKPST